MYVFSTINRCKKILESIVEQNEVRETIVKYLQSGNPLFAKLDEIPYDDSLVELGYVDSFGVIDIVTFLEGTYNIQILDEEITKEKFGSINKMIALILSKR